MCRSVWKDLREGGWEGGGVGGRAGGKGGREGEREGEGRGGEGGREGEVEGEGEGGRERDLRARTASSAHALFVSAYARDGCIYRPG